MSVLEPFQTSKDDKDDRSKDADGNIEVSVDKSGNRSAVVKKSSSKRRRTPSISSSSSSSSSQSSSSSSSPSNLEKVIDKSLLKLRRITKKLKQAGYQVEVGIGTQSSKDASTSKKPEVQQTFPSSPSSSSPSTSKSQPQKNSSSVNAQNETQSESTSSRSDRHQRGSTSVRGQNVREKVDAPKFIVRTKDDICRMIIEFDKSHGGQTFRQDLVNMCTQNQTSEPCKFYNIGECKSTNKFAHFIGGKEVNHVCSDCELVVPGLGALHKAESRDCPIFLTMQYD